ncbi:MAG: hypothetical protein ACJ8BW_18375 [Ktedonobacteraceae bacterium]|jgi:hypothetical protein
MLVDSFLAALEYSKFPVFSEKEQLAWVGQAPIHFTERNQV